MALDGAGYVTVDDAGNQEHQKDERDDGVHERGAVSGQFAVGGAER